MTEPDWNDLTDEQQQAVERCAGVIGRRLQARGTHLAACTFDDGTYVVVTQGVAADMLRAAVADIPAKGEV